MKKSLLITTPYLNNIGGTEIEAVTTAIHLYDTKQFNKVSVFTPKDIKEQLYTKMLNKRDIKFFVYPKVLESTLVGLIDRCFFRLGIKIRVSEYLYWKYKSQLYSNLYVLTYPMSIYFFPILKAFGHNKSKSAKITMSHFKALPKHHIKRYSKLNTIVVFSKEQGDYWKLKYEFKNIVVKDIIIPNESNLIKVKTLDFKKNAGLKFGFLGRIVKEKNIEDMIRLVAFLNNEHNQHSSLIIQGKGEVNYIKTLMSLAKKLEILHNVSFINEVVSPSQTHLFYSKINVFLVTSIHEGGPITALEAAAAGRMILSYNVGAMQARFDSMPLVINNTFGELCTSALSFIELSEKDKQSIVLKIKALYKLRLSNKNKSLELSNIIRDEY